MNETELFWERLYEEIIIEHFELMFRFLWI